VGWTRGPRLTATGVRPAQFRLLQVLAAAPDIEDVDVWGAWTGLALAVRAHFGRSERGASLVEYALLVALIAVVRIVAVSLLGKNASKKFSSVGSAIQ
jgi:pilus assembly protein Flp/PilA